MEFLRRLGGERTVSAGIRRAIETLVRLDPVSSVPPPAPSSWAPCLPRPAPTCCACCGPRGSKRNNNRCYMEKIVNVGPGLALFWADPDDLREQDVNPQVMPPTMFGQLVANVGKRGLLESVPFCAVPAGKETVEIVSGHKRVRATREARLVRIVNMMRPLYL